MLTAHGTARSTYLILAEQLNFKKLIEVINISGYLTTSSIYAISASLLTLENQTSLFCIALALVVAALLDS